MCAKNHILIFSSFLDIWENVEWPRFFGPPGILCTLQLFVVAFVSITVFCAETRAPYCRSERTARYFRQLRLWVLKISILPLNCPKIGGFSPTFCIFGQTFSNKKSFRQFSDSPKFWKGAIVPLPAATTPLVILKFAWKYCGICFTTKTDTWLNGRHIINRNARRLIMFISIM